MRAIADGARRAAGAITAVIGKARDLVTRLARAARDAARRVWQAATDRLSRLWQAVTAAARKAMSAVSAVVQKVASALAMVRNILKLLGNKLLTFIIDAVRDPQGKIVNPILAIAEPLVGQIPGKSDELAKQQAAQVPAGGAVAQRLAVQRVPEQAQQAPPTETFFGGVKRHLSAVGTYFADNWKAILKKVIIDVLFLVPMLMEEGPKLFEETRMTFSGGGGIDQLDHGLQAVRHLVSIVAGTLATIGVWALVIGLCGGPVAEGAVLGVYQTASWTVIAVDLSLAAVELGKYAYSATRPGVDANLRDRYLGMFASTGVSTVITLALVALGVLASRLANKIKLRRIAAAAAKAADQRKALPPVKDQPPPVKENPPPVSDDEPTLKMRKPERFGLPEEGYHPDRGFMDYLPKPIPPEGWKLHISADATSARGVADAVLPRLRQMGVNHKVVGTLEALEGMSGTQQGKFVTIYPDNTAHAKQIVSAMDSAVSGVSGGAPAVEGELRVGSRIYTRYGGYTKGTVTAPNGAEVPDVRGQISPPWVENPWLRTTPAPNPIPRGDRDGGTQ